MRLNSNIDDSLFKAAKVAAAKDDLTLTELVEKALQAYLSASPSEPKQLISQDPGFPDPKNTVLVQGDSNAWRLVPPPAQPVRCNYPGCKQPATGIHRFFDKEEFTLKLCDSHATEAQKLETYRERIDNANPIKP